MKILKIGGMRFREKRRQLTTSLNTRQIDRQIDGDGDGNGDRERERERDKRVQVDVGKHFLAA